MVNNQDERAAHAGGRHRVETYGIDTRGRRRRAGISRQSPTTWDRGNNNGGCRFIVPWPTHFFLLTYTIEFDFTNRRQRTRGAILATRKRLRSGRRHAGSRVAFNRLARPLKTIARREGAKDRGGGIIRRGWEEKTSHGVKNFRGLRVDVFDVS